jgi:hypothetical protein
MRKICTETKKLTLSVARPFTSRRRNKVGTSIPVLGAGFTVIFMLACLSSPGIGLLVDWVARHRQQATKGQ